MPISVNAMTASMAITIMIGIMPFSSRRGFPASVVLALAGGKNSTVGDERKLSHGARRRQFAGGARNQVGDAARFGSKLETSIISVASEPWIHDIRLAIPFDRSGSIAVTSVKLSWGPEQVTARINKKEVPWESTLNTAVGSQTSAA